MDFGNILEQWESTTGKNSGGKSSDNKKPVKSGKKANADWIEKASTNHSPAKSQSKSSSFHDAMNKWLDANGTQDKDKNAKEKAQRRAEKATNYAILPVDETLDLHGLTQDEAEKALDTFIYNAKRHGCRKVLIIHGKGIHSPDGNAVLARLVQNFIERDKRCGASGHPTNRDGATGATWVIIK